MSSNQETPRRPTRRLLLTTLAVGAVLAAVTAIALNPTGPLEVDGNAIDDPMGGDDWDVNLPMITTDHISRNPGVEDAFIQGGSKDERDISSAGISSQYWRWGAASVPDKDDLVHTFAKEYAGNGTKVLYFGATRSDNNGDAAIGFWFLKNPVAFATAPNFSGKHTDGDILITGDFGTGGVKALNIFVWTGVKDATDPVLPGVTTLSYPLHLVKSSAGNPVAVFCDVGTGSSNNGMCASANTAPVTIPNNMLDYRFKSGGGNIFPADGKFPIGTFLEGGIDLGALGLPTDACYSTVLAMTRTSSSTTAQLKDLVLLPFGSCGITVAKVCKTSNVDVSGNFITSKFDVTVTAQGGTVSDVEFEEDISLPGFTNADTMPTQFPRCKRTDTGKWLQTDGETLVAASLPQGPGVTVEVQCDHLTEQLYNNVSAFADDGAGGVSDGFTMENTCAPLFTTEIQIEKFCDTVEIISSGGTVQPKVCNKLTVTNLSTEALKGIALYDDPDGSGPEVQVTADSISGTAVPTTLAVGAHFDVIHCYTPTTTQSGQTDPKIANFLNEARVIGEGFFSGDDVDDATNKQCDLCPLKP